MEQPVKRFDPITGEPLLPGLERPVQPSESAPSAEPQPQQPPVQPLPAEKPQKPRQFAE